MQIIENIIRKILIFFGIIKEEKDLLKEKNIYKKKNIMTDYEYKFYLILDATHNTKKRKSRDIKVKSICANAGLNLITFYAKYANEKSYVLNRVLASITTNNNNNIEPTNNKIKTS